jgi:hypothetical protein
LAEVKVRDSKSSRIGRFLVAISGAEVDDVLKLYPSAPLAIFYFSPESPFAWSCATQGAPPLFEALIEIDRRGEQVRRQQYRLTN